MMIILVLLASFLPISAYKIAILAADVANSQVLFNYRIASTLADAGNDVTVVFIASYKNRDISGLKVPKNVKVKKVDSNIGQTMEEVNEIWAKFMYTPMDPMDPRNMQFFKHFKKILTDTCKNTLKNKEFLKWLEDEKFDLAFANTYHTCPIGLIHIAKIPSWIWMDSGPLKEYMATLLGAPNIPSYMSPIMMPSHDTMTYWERFNSLKTHVFLYFMYPKMMAGVENEHFRELINPNFPDLNDLARKCPLAMVNNNDLYSLPRPLPAKIINIGGIGAKLKDAKPLPENFEKIAQKGKGLVLFSFGSVAQFHLAPESWKQAILGAFKRLSDYQFVVRYDSDYENLPENVHFFKWLPQADLLQHKRTKAFLTHGGYNSLQEAIGAGIPLVMLGLFGDQMKNSKVAEKHGFARILDKANFTADAIYDTLYDVLHDPKYSKNVKKLSAMVNKQPIPPEMLLVKWTEFVAEFKSLENLEPASLKLNALQYYSLDIILPLIAVTLIGLYIAYVFIKFVIRKACSFFGKKEKTQ